MTLRLNVRSRPDAMKVSFSNTHLFIAAGSGRMVCTGKMLDGANKGFGGCRSTLSVVHTGVRKPTESSRWLYGFTVMWLA